MIGSLLAGFVLIPILGVGKTTALMVGCNLSIAAFVLTFRRAPGTARWIRSASIALALLLVLVWPRGILYPLYEFPEPGGEIIFSNEGPAGTVTVHRHPDYRVISIDGSNVAGTDLPLRTTQKLQAHIPALLGRSPRRVLQIGFGSGETTRVMGLYSPERIDMVEINRDVIAVSDRFFSDINGGIIRSPNFNPVIMDGKNYLLFSRDKYDIIMNDSIYPGLTGSSSLYTIDHFRTCREHLNPGGVLSSWFPIDLSLSDQRTVAGTFLEVFPVSTLWFGHNCRNKHALLVGIKTEDDFRVDFGRFRRALDDPEIRGDLAEIGLSDEASLLDCFIMGPQGLRAFAGNAPINSDDKPRLEFSKTKFRSIPGSVAAALRTLLPLREDVLAYLAEDGGEIEGDPEAVVRLRQYSQSTPHVLRGLLDDIEDIPGRLTVEFETALKLNPEDVNARNFLDFLPRELERAKLEVTRHPSDARKRLDLAVEYLKRGEYEEAVLCYRAALAGDPENVPALEKLGLAYSLLGSGYLKQAINSYLEVLKLDPDNLNACINLGVALGNGLQRWDEALKYYRRAVRIDPDAPEGYYNLGLAYMEMRQWPVAVSAYQQAIDRGMDNPYIYNELGIGLARVGRDREALTAFERAVERDSSFQEARQNLEYLKNRLP